MPALTYRQPPAQHEPNITRAYRLGKSETLYAFHQLLVARRYSARDLQYAIVSRMYELSTVDRNALLGAKNSQNFQECQGVADACSFCFDLVATHKLSGETLRRRIADHLLAAWPTDYLEYRQRYMAFLEKDPTMPDKVDCLDLPAWYEIVDSLAYVVDRDRRAGQPPSEDQRILQLQLLRIPGEPTPDAE